VFGEFALAVENSKVDPDMVARPAGDAGDPDPSEHV